jgi:hypothetical protein
VTWNTILIIKWLGKTLRKVWHIGEVLNNKWKRENQKEEFKDAETGMRLICLRNRKGKKKEKGQSKG